MSTTTTNVKLTTSDDKEFEVPLAIAKMSETVKHMIDDIGADTSIPLPNVNSAVMTKVIEWCKQHVNDPAPEPKTETKPDEKTDEKKTDEKKTDEKRTDDISAWDQDFFKVDQSTLFEIILAANYLDIQRLLQLGCKTVANMIKGKTPEEIRKTFNIKNDFTPEEEEQVRKENEWCEEKPATS